MDVAQGFTTTALAGGSTTHPIANGTCTMPPTEPTWSGLSKSASTTRCSQRYMGLVCDMREPSVETRQTKYVEGAQGRRTMSNRASADGDFLAQEAEFTVGSVIFHASLVDRLVIRHQREYVVLLVRRNQLRALCDTNAEAAILRQRMK